MSRTLRGFDSEYPYLGARWEGGDADVIDPHLIDEEEAYGADNEGEDDDELTELEGDVEEGGKFKMFSSAPWLLPAAAGVGAGILGTALVTGMVRKHKRKKAGYSGLADIEDFEDDFFGADNEGEDDDELTELEGDVEEGGKFKMFSSAPWLLPAAAGVGAGILGTALVTGMVRKHKRKKAGYSGLGEEDFGAIGDAVADEFGFDRMDLFGAHQIDPRTGALIRPQAPAEPSHSPKDAASAAHSWFFRARHVDSTVPRQGTWAPGDTWYTSISLPQHAYPEIDRNMQAIAQKHGVAVLRANPKTGGLVSYIFTTSPFSSSAWYKLQGYTLKPLHRAV